MAELRTHFHLFVYGTLRAGSNASALLGDAEWLGAAQVGGVLYNIDDEFPALVLYGNTPIAGEVWRCASDLLPRLDAYEGVDKGLFRRIGVEVEQPGRAGKIACWTYVAGPALSRKLVPAQRIETWPVSEVP